MNPGRGAARSAPLLVLFLVNVLNFYDRQVLGAVLEPLHREFGLSDTQLATLATAFTLLYAVAGLPLGRLADSWSRKRLLAIGVGVWAALTALGGLASSYGMLLATRLGVGIGEATCAPAATSWIGDLVPAERRARAMAIFMMAVPIGGFLSFAIGGPVAQSWGWRAALVLAAVPAAALVPALLALREPRWGSFQPANTRLLADVPTPPDTHSSNVSHSRSDPSHDRAGVEKQRLAGGSACPTPKQSGQSGQSGTDAFVCQPASLSPWLLARIPAFWWIAASGAIVNFMLYSFSFFLPAFLTRYHGLTVARAGVWSGVGSGAAGVLGALAAGYLGDRVTRDLGRRRLLLAAAAAALAAIPAFAAILEPAGSVLVAMLLLMLAYGLWQTYYGLVYAAIQDIVPAQLRGTAMAIYYLSMYLCGASFGPLVTGRLSDHFARAAANGGVTLDAARAIGLHQAMYLVPACSLALAAALWAAGRSWRQE
ncbi:MAG: MFS transporter [Bryobacteraceae bacterium]